MNIFEDRSQVVSKEKEVYDFRLETPKIEPPLEFVEELKRVANIPFRRCMANSALAGHVQAREAIAKTLSKERGLPFTAQHVIMTAGGAGALNIILKAILNPGDEVIVLSPLYLEYPYYIDNHGGVCCVAETNADFTLNIDAIAAKTTPRTKAIIINSPNNPSGMIYFDESLKSTARLLNEKNRQFGNDIFLIYDAAYQDIVYDGNKLPDIFNIYSNTIFAASYSKPLSIPGERIGYAAVHPAMKNSRELMEALTFANRVLGYLSAPVLMQHVVTNLQGVCVDRAEYQGRRDMFCNALQDFGYSFTRPMGAYYIFTKTPGDDLVFTQELAKEGILVLPGKSFGRSGYIRIAFCVKKETIKKSLPGFKKVKDFYRH
ncbi:pyridoxal phosphate-dependent aminotransferase [Candidatus Kuenenia stuttgartiensis]|uniref:pyridoxal phosphate-dependent aminotransferase n=1 Tax=Kuenenia stuttgartiensis TaxID=174633 RepID=UPI00146C2C1E|nr:pyridoxal phosphate-dependent aminotransferase [Candidatus Kuenenia stuttgartiensis]